MHKKHYQVIGTLLLMFHLSAMTDRAASLLKFGGTYGPGVSGSGSFNSTKRVTIP